MSVRDILTECGLRIVTPEIIIFIFYLLLSSLFVLFIIIVNFVNQWYELRSATIKDYHC